MNKESNIVIIMKSISYILAGCLFWPKFKINFFMNQPLTFELGVTATIITLMWYYLAYKEIIKVKVENKKLYYEGYE